MFNSIKTKTISVQGQRGDVKKAKLFITLGRHANFEENIKKFNEIRAENDKNHPRKNDDKEEET